MEGGTLWLLLVAVVGVARAFYGPSDDVVELTPSNFDSLVVNSGDVWIVEFYAPWCGHCQSFAGEYKKTAKALKGFVKVGAVDASEHQSLGGRYGVRGFPTVKIFGANKQSPTDYQGERKAQAIASNAINVMREVITARLGGKAGGGGSGGRSSGGGSGAGSDKDVVQLTDSNFESLVLNSDDTWLVEFFAPWCGHCKNLAPHWASAATQLKGKVKLGAVDATVHTVIASKFSIQGYPTIKYFQSGSKSYDSAQEYDGGRDADGIVSWALDKWSQNQPPPEVYQLISQQVLDKCTEKQLCFVSFLPHILDSGADTRNGYLTSLKEVAEQYKQRSFGWVWIEGGANMDLEASVEVGGFGYPALVAVNGRKGAYSSLRGSFGKPGIKEFVRDLIGMRSPIVTLRGGKLPAVPTTEPWDGKDGQLPDLDDDQDVSDVELDDLDTKDEL